MNQIVKRVFIFASAAGLGLAASGTLMAQVPLKVSISGTSLAQGGTNNLDTRVRPPVQTPVTTGSILRQLALDEKTAGLWNSRTFPAGAELWYLPNTGFQVDTGRGSPLLVVSNILRLTSAGTNSLNSLADLASGAVNQTNWQLVGFTYDATAAGGTNKYTVYGVGTIATKDTKPNAGGFFTQTQTFSLQHGTGEGVDADGVSILLTGVTITARGSAFYNIASPPANTNQAVFFP